MAKTFVAINDWSHKLLREITRQTPLRRAGLESRTGAVQYRVEPERLPQNYFSLVACHTLDGLPLDQVRSGRWRARESSRCALMRADCSLDLTRLDRRCWRDLRLASARGGPAMLSGELLVFGTGMLRGGSPGNPHGRICTRLEHVSARILALQRMPQSGALEKVCYDSSNLIYGDALGELEQLWERRADTAFLDQVAHSLAEYHDWRWLPLSPHPPLNSVAVAEMHLRSQALWRAPASNGRFLLRRIEFLLEHTILDSSASTQVRPQRAHPASGQNWQTDRSGYDGWLPGSGAARNG